MSKKVLHFVRKKSQLRASFIKNQISNHKVYSPSVVYKFDRYKGIDGGFAEFDYTDLEEINLANYETIWSKFLYKVFKRVSRKQAQLIIDYIVKQKIDVLHFHYGTDAGIYLPMLSKVKLPKVVSFYGYECSGFPKRFLGYGKVFLQNRTFKHATKIFAMSEDMQKDLIEIGCPKEKLIVHYYGTDTKKFETLHCYRDESIINFLIISGLAPQKGHVFLLKAFHKAHKRNPNIKLTIVGEGETKPLIEGIISNLDMNSYVSLNPFVVYGSPEHKSYFANADVFIHPSLTDTNGDKEGIPGAIIEAMAAGLPIISTNHAGIPYIIDNGKSGLLVDEWDEKSLIEAILKMASDAAVREEMGSLGQKYAIENLDLFNKEIELESIYQDIE